MMTLLLALTLQQQAPVVSPEVKAVGPAIVVTTPAGVIFRILVLSRSAT